MLTLLLTIGGYASRDASAASRNVYDQQRSHDDGTANSTTAAARQGAPQTIYAPHDGVRQRASPHASEEGLFSGSMEHNIDVGRREAVRPAYNETVWGTHAPADDARQVPTRSATSTAGATCARCTVGLVNGTWSPLPVDVQCARAWMSCWHGAILCGAADGASDCGNVRPHASRMEAARTNFESLLERARRARGRSDDLESRASTFESRRTRLESRAATLESRAYKFLLRADRLELRRTAQLRTA